jgi:O-acetyl-ADP-ribose deacetylase (regulator of RNase III)
VAGKIDDVALSETHASDPSITLPSGTAIRTPGLEIGKTFRGLKIRGLLGQGAMGQAYLASHVSLRVPVVIKLFRQAGSDPLSEAHLAARIGSPWVVPVLDAGIEQGMPYVMQRYVDGIDLDELLAIHEAADRSIPVATLVRYAVHVFHGLSAIHVAGVVHRDIKPPNLFLAGSGDAMVGDLGIAVDPTGTHQAAVAGTPLFIAPELWTGGHASVRSDLYSAGATLHLLWQRKPPFAAGSAMELARLHCDEPYVPPKSTDPVGAYFGAVLARLLSKNPEDRPESALAAARTLERIASPAPELRGHDDGVANVGNVMIHIEHRRIATATTDVIVSAANETVDMDTGVSGALRKAGGDEILAELRTHGPQTMGRVTWTKGGKLKCTDIAHAVAAAGGAICIQRTVLRTLFEAERRGHRSITFPALGTGVGGVPHGLSARLVLEAIRTFASFAPRHTRSIRIALPTPETLAQWTTGLLALDADAVHR